MKYILNSNHDYNYPKLTPIIFNWVKKILLKKNKLKKILLKHGSPINICNVEEFVHNIKNFEGILKKYNLKFKILFAKKANKFMGFAVQAKEAGIGIDVVSHNELLECLRIGCAKEKIIITGVVKTSKIINLAIRNGITVIVDNFDELLTINKAAKKFGRICSVGLRISGFKINNKKVYSRFGFDIDEVDRIINFINDRKLFNLKISGLHFHLSGYSIKERSGAIISLINVSKVFEKHGFCLSFIDIGGGFTVNYLKFEREWQNFISSLKAAVMGRRSPITFQNNGLGFLRCEKKLFGAQSFYPFYNKIFKENYLEKILLSKDFNGKEIYKLINDNNLELRIEPGRALLDQCGITLASIVFTKRDQNDDLLIGLEMNMTQLLSSSSEFCLDPILLSFKKAKINIEKNKKTLGYLVGSYCLEKDIILKRKIIFNQTPQVGDIICFINTAGYMMHLFESRAHQVDLAHNLMYTDI